MVRDLKDRSIQIEAFAMGIDIVFHEQIVHLNVLFCKVLPLSFSDGFAGFYRADMCRDQLFILAAHKLSEI